MGRRFIGTFPLPELMPIQSKRVPHLMENNNSINVRAECMRVRHALPCISSMEEKQTSNPYKKAKSHKQRRALAKCCPGRMNIHARWVRVPRCNTGLSGMS